MAEFDNFAGNYKSILNETLGRFGETLDYYTRYKASYIRRIVGDEYSGKVLDYGCGIGLLLQALKTFLPKASLMGFDISVESIGAIDKSIRDRIKFTGKVDELDKDYDLVVVSNVFHHIPIASRHDAMSEIARCIAIGGHLIVFEHNPLNPITRVVVNRCPFDEDAILLSPAELKAYLHPAGLSYLRKDYIVFFPRPLAAFSKVEPFLRFLPLGAQYAIVGKKHE